jgi:hypothetical protein
MTRLGKEYDSPTSYPHDVVRRGSSTSTVTFARDHEMHDEPSTYSDEDGNSSRPTSNGYVYVDALARLHVVMGTALSDTSIYYTMFAGLSCVERVKYTR